MEIKNLFNLILLGLSLTTILITLISYIIFRIRYSLAFHQKPIIHRLEGHYFRRYAPHLEEINKEQKVKINKKSDKPGATKQKLILSFTILFIFVIGLFSTEHYISFRRELIKKTKSAQEYRAIIEGGLLKKYEYDPLIKNPTLNEYFSNFYFTRLNQLAHHLKSTKVVLFSTKKNLENVHEHRQAILLWKSFLQRYQVDLKIIEQESQLGKEDLIIIPHLKYLTINEKVRIDELIKKGHSFLFTGLSGFEHQNYNWLEKFFDFKIRDDKEIHQNSPSIFTNQSALWWDIPPGIILPWFPLTMNYSIFGKNEIAQGFESNFSGKIIEKDGLPSIRFVKKDLTPTRLIWMAFDPIPEELNAQLETLPYVDNILLSTLNWLSYKPIAHVTPWKEGVNSSFAFSINIKEKDNYLNNIIKNLKSLKIPTTYFILSSLYRSEIDLFEDLNQDSDEVGSHGDDDQLMTLFDREKNFYRLERSRFDIEENWKKRVYGYRPIKEDINPEILGSVYQNKFSYIFGDKRFFRLAPLQLAEGELIFFPRVMEDDYSIQRNKLLSSPELISKFLIQEWNYVQNLGGLYLLNINPFIMGTPFYLEGLKLFLNELNKSPVWKTTLSELSQWWIDRDHLIPSIEWIKEGKEALLFVKNESKHRIQNVKVVVYLGMNISHHLRGPSSDINVFSDHLIVNFKVIEALSSQKMSISIKSP